MTFKIGDVVVYNLFGNKEKFDSSSHLHDMTGVIVCTDPDWRSDVYGVDFTMSIAEYRGDSLHNLEEHLEDDTGYWVSEGKLAHVKPKVLIELEDMI